MPSLGGIQFLLFWLMKAFDEKLDTRINDRIVFIVPRGSDKNVHLNFRNIDVVEYDIPDGRFSTALFMKTLAGISKRYALDLIHCHSASTEGSWCLGAKILSHTPYMVTCHGSDVAKDKRFNYGSRLKKSTDFFVRMALKHASYITTLSSDMVPFVRDAGGSRAPLKIIPEGIETNVPISDDESREMESHIKEKYHITDINTIYLTLSGMREIKGHAPMITAFAKALNNDENLALFIGAQNTIYEEKLKSQIEAFGIQKHIHFIGNVRGAEKKAWFHIADVYCNTAFFEPFGIVYIESIFYGNAVLGSIHGGGKDIFDHKKSAYLVNPENTDEITDGILALRDAGLRDSFAREARKKLPRYDIGRICDDYIAVYDEIGTNLNN